MNTIIKFTDRSTEIACWLLLIIALIITAVVSLSYFFSWGSIALQELALYCHSFLLSLLMAYTLRHDDHVRVDIFYRQFSPRKKTWVNILGTLFLLMPLCLTMLAYSWQYVINSWQILEQSQDPNGLQFIYIQKSTLLILPALLLLQAIFTLAKCICELRVINTENKACGVSNNG